MVHSAQDKIKERVRDCLKKTDTLMCSDGESGFRELDRIQFLDGIWKKRETRIV